MVSGFTIHILGCGSAVPIPGKQHTSQWITLNERHYLVDCGEGTQLQIRRKKLPMLRLSAIFISHVHSDHILGLPSLLDTMDLLGRKKALHLIAPESLFQFLDAYFSFTKHTPKFSIVRKAIPKEKKPEILFEDKGIEVTGFPLKHSIPCHGFLFRERLPLPNICKNKIKEYALTPVEIRQAKAGIEITRPPHFRLLPEAVLLPRRASRSYAFFTDTRPCMQWKDYLQGIELLYHEATFGFSARERAKKTFHSTAAEAGEFAAACQVGTLLIGHYSLRYKGRSELLSEASLVFPSTFEAFDGMDIAILEDGKVKIENPKTESNG
jgi:ribonuclease Z